MKNKVFIIVEKSRYAPGVNDEKEFTSVDCTASSYGSGNPCDTPEEVEDAIRHCKKLIISQGDIPVVDNKIEARTLEGWCQ
ncbi:hypothetical protein LCGC14_2826110 [marine sediment metagenome]|uniref:Uncharacterized protein n=1 Tax=marine sediment metagenome TaxID=412755 RepID=A0A0F9B6L0_9ZZZZ